MGLIEQSRNTATVKSHIGAGAESYRRLEAHCTGLCTYILNIVSCNGFVVTINRPFGDNYDIQPFHPCAVLQKEGVVEKQHDRKTECGCDVGFQKHGSHEWREGQTERERTAPFVIKAELSPRLQLIKKTKSCFYRCLSTRLHHEINKLLGNSNKGS